MQELHALAASLDVRIEYADLMHLHRDGDYNRRTRTIRLQHGMLYRLERSVLAHELIHALRGDEKTIFGYHNDRDERLADELASHLLIDPTEYRIAEEKCGNNAEGIAIELAVMDWIVVAYERTLNRIGDTIYVNAKMGAGQWDKRLLA